MYEPFFGLSDKPFNVTPDPRYLYLADSHEEALSALVYGIRERKGLITLTGPVGVGKTTVLFSFFERIQRDVEIAFFPGGVTGSRVDFFQELCKQFRLPAESSSLFDLTRTLKDFTSRKLEEDRNVIVLVDEAQDLGVEELNHFRYLNNLETPDTKFFQIVLTGMPELDEKLRDEKLLSLRQRVAIRCVIQPLDPPSSIEYVLHRLRVAGNPSDNLFTPGALWRIVNYSQGIPRRINVLCDNAMIIAFALKKVPVEEAFVVEALEGMEGEDWEKEAEPAVSREEVETLLYEASRRLQERAAPADPPPEPREAASEREGRGSGAVAPAAARRDVEYPRKVSVRQVEEGLPGRSGNRTAIIAALVITGCVLGGLLLHLCLGRDTLESPVPKPVPESAGPMAPWPEQEVPLKEPALPPPGILTGDAGLVMERSPAVPEEPVPEAPVPAMELLPDAPGPEEEDGEESLAPSGPRAVWAIALARYGTLTLEVLQDLETRNPGIRDWNRLSADTDLRLPDTLESSRGPVDFYTVQVISFRQERNIRKAAERLCAEGNQNVFVLRPDPEPAAEDGRSWYSCCVGVFASETAAEQWRVRMRQAGFHDAFVVRLRAVPLKEVLFPCPE